MSVVNAQDADDADEEQEQELHWLQPGGEGDNHGPQPLLSPWSLALASILDDGLNLNETQEIGVGDAAGGGDDDDMSFEADPLFTAVDLDDAADGNYDIFSDPGSAPNTPRRSSSLCPSSLALGVADQEPHDRGDSITMDSRSSASPLPSSANNSPAVLSPSCLFTPDPTRLASPLLSPSYPYSMDAYALLQEEGDPIAPELVSSPPLLGQQSSTAPVPQEEREEAVKPHESQDSSSLDLLLPSPPPTSRAPMENSVRITRRAFSLPPRPLYPPPTSITPTASRPDNGQEAVMESDFGTEADEKGEMALLAQPMLRRSASQTGGDVTMSGQNAGLVVGGRKRKLDAVTSPDERQPETDSSRIPFKKRKRPNKTNRRSGRKKGKEKDKNNAVGNGSPEEPPSAAAAAAVQHTPPLSSAPTKAKTAILSLPFELLAEIVSYLRTPDLLALARTSKPFCHTLVAPGSEWLWRQARLRCIPRSLPDPNEIMLGLNENQGDGPVFGSTFDFIMATLFPDGLDGEEEHAATETQVTQAAVTEDVESTPVAGGPTSSDPVGTEATAVDSIPLGGSGQPDGDSENTSRKAEEQKKPWTEWAFAAFVFDPGPCSICGRVTTLAYVSYSLRYRKCGRSECRASHHGLTPDTTMQRIPPDLVLSLPYAKLPLSRPTLHGRCKYYLVKEYNREILRYRTAAFNRDTKAMDDIRAEWHARAPYIKRLNQLSQSLLTWQAAYDRALTKVRGANDKAWKRIATERRVDRQDMINSPTLQKLLRESRYRLTVISPEEWGTHKDAVVKEAQMLNIRRLQRESERRLLAHRASMDVFYSFLRVQSNAEDPSSSSFTSATIPIIPPLSEFKKLDTIKLLMSSKDHAEHMNVEKAMHDAGSALGTIIRLEISRWVETMKAKLGALLDAGSSRQGVGSTFTHKRDNIYMALVNRPSAFFLCSLCTSHRDESAPYASGERLWRALSFEDVVQHQCRGAWASGGVVWSVEHYAPDWVAVAAMKEVLSKAGIDEDAVDVKERMITIERRIRCETCEGKIIVPLKDIVRHARRHDEFTCRITASPQTSVLSKTTERLLHGQGPVVHKQANIKKYGCKHCPHSKQHLSFNGLRSHLKAKHGYDHIGDEDFYVRGTKKPPQTKPGQTVSVSGGTT